jgi:hypothetical protein
VTASSAQFDLVTAALGLPRTLAYGAVRGSGNRVFFQEQAVYPAPPGSRIAIHLLGEGPWQGFFDGAVNLWINRAPAYMPYVHFHPGVDGEIGTGMAATSTGGDNHVTDIWTFSPISFDVTTFSRYAYIAMLVNPDANSPGPDLEVLGDYKAMKCRIFDNTGVQTSFAWTVNPAWWILDYHIRKFILREGKANQPLVAAERARIDWQSFYDASLYFDADIGGGIPRFSDGGLVFVDQGLTAAAVFDKMLLMCRSYLLERAGKLYLYADQARGSVFTFSSDNVQAGSLKVTKSNTRMARNRVVASWREMALASGSSDDATRFGLGTKNFDNEAHQYAIGTRGPGLATIPKVLEIQLDYGNNSSERVSRLANFQRLRALGDDLDNNATYVGPSEFELTGFEHSAAFRAVRPGDRVTLHKSLGEEHDALTFEVLKMRVKPDGSRLFSGLEYQPNAFTDSATVQQTTQAPVPGSGLSPAAVAGFLGPSPFGRNMVGNPGFESNYVKAPADTNLAVGAMVADGWKHSLNQGSPMFAVFRNATEYAVTVFGAACCAMLAKTGITLAAGASYQAMVQSIAQIPLSIGQLLRVSGQINWSFNVVAGITPSVELGVFLFDEGGAHSMFLSAIGTGNSGLWGKITAAMVIPATVPGGGPPVYGVFFVSNKITNTTGSPIAVGANNVSSVFFDDLECIFQTKAFDITPLNTAGAPTTTDICSQTGATTNIDVANSTFQFGDGQVSYTGGSVDPGSYGHWFIYGDDPTFSGGAITYHATASWSDLSADNGRIFFGEIVTTGGGGALSGLTGGQSAARSGGLQF